MGNWKRVIREIRGRRSERTVQREYKDVNYVLKYVYFFKGTFFRGNKRIVYFLFFSIEMQNGEKGRISIKSKLMNNLNPWMDKEYPFFNFNIVKVHVYT